MLTLKVCECVKVERCIPCFPLFPSHIAVTCVSTAGLPARALLQVSSVPASHLEFVTNNGATAWDRLVI